MNDAYADVVVPVFSEVIAIEEQLAHDKTATLNEVKRRVRGLVENARQRVAVDPVLRDDYRLADYGLVAWIDEMFTESDWGRMESVDWGTGDHVLEWDLYKDHNRGKRFYEEAALAEDRRAGDPLETYLLCVTLGFDGVMGQRGAEGRFREWVERIYEEVSSVNAVPPRPFPEDAKGNVPGGLKPLRGPMLLLTVSILTAVTAIVTTFGYIMAVHHFVASQH